MQNQEGKSAWGEFVDAIRYCIESKRGKYSLDTYLDIIGEYTDSQIIEAKTGEKLKYTGGQCSVKNDRENECYVFSVHMYFMSNTGETITKEASRSLPKKRFTSETEKTIGDGKTFEILSPK